MGALRGALPPIEYLGGAVGQSVTSTASVDCGKSWLQFPEAKRDHREISDPADSSVKVHSIITKKTDACGTRHLSPIAVGKEQGGPSNTGAEYAGPGSGNWRTAPGKN